MSTPLPPMRAVETVLIEHEGRPHFCLHDPSGCVEGQILLSPHAFLVASCLNGENDAAAVQRIFAEQCGGALVPQDQILRVVEYLDKAGFLLTPRFFELRERMETEFREAPSRTAAFAGRSYPDDPAQLRKFIDGFFTDPEGPGPLGIGGGEDAPPLRGLIVPHIDFARGGAVYAHGYKRLYEAGTPRTVFIFGVAHGGGSTPFIVTRKPFATPFGVLDTDQDAIDHVAGACQWDIFADELAHRKEHSIEFQAVMLGYLYGTDVKIVPILCAPFSDDLSLTDPNTLEPVASFLEACRAYAAPAERRITVIAAADLAHVGKRFGDPFDIDDPIIAAVRARDEEDLDHAAACAPERWYASVMQDGNSRKVCGLGCIYATLKTLDGLSVGRMLHYGHAPDPVGGMVSFASMAFAESGRNDA